MLFMIYGWAKGSWATVLKVKAKGTYLNIHTQVGGVFLTKNEKPKTKNGF